MLLDIYTLRMGRVNKVGRRLPVSP